MGADIKVIKGDISEIKASIKEIINGAITRSEYSEVVKVQEDHESRTRLLETKTTKIMTYGTAGVLFIGAIEFVIQLYFKTH